MSSLCQQQGRHTPSFVVSLQGLRYLPGCWAPGSLSGGVRTSGSVSGATISRADAGSVWTRRNTTLGGKGWIAAAEQNSSLCMKAK